MRAWVIAALMVVPVIAEASPADHCMAQLDARGVSYRVAARSGISIGVEITGPLGGITWTSTSKAALVIDCSLAVSLAEAGPYLKALGVQTAKFSSAFSKRMVRGTTHPSKHSYGLAIDVPRFSGSEIGELTVALDFEQGLGDKVDCLGQPATQAGAILKVMQCQLVRSGLFHLVLSPDYDDAHNDHFHLEALPWTDRPTIRAERPAIY